MLSYRRALLIALSVITLFLLLRNRYSTPPQTRSFSSSTSAHTSKTPTRKSSILPQLLSSKHITRRPLNELSNKPLRAQLAYQFPYEPLSRFPAYIWQTWKTSPSSSDFPEPWRDFEGQWTTLHPGFIHEVITDAGAVHILRHLYSGIPNVVDAYEALPQPVLRADFFRYLILLARGGIYTDMDTWPLKSAAEWVPASVPRESYGLVIGIEADPDRDDWAQWYSRRVQFCQWTIQAKPGHPVLREIVAHITEMTLARKRAGKLYDFDVKQVVDLTGPALWTDKIFAYFNDPEHFDLSTGTGLTAGNITWRQFTGISAQKKLGDVIVLPLTSFSPGVGQMGAGDDDDPLAFVKHFFQGSWKPDWERHIGGDTGKTDDPSPQQEQVVEGLIV